MTAGEVVVGVDIGTTSTKVDRVRHRRTTARRRTRSATRSTSRTRAAPSRTPSGSSTRCVESVPAHVVAELAGPVAGLSFSSAMHSLIGLDADGVPLTPSVTWADSRASAQAERLRAAPPAGWPCTAAPARRCTRWRRCPSWSGSASRSRSCSSGSRTGSGIKDYVLLRLAETLVIDHSVASATGLMDIYRLAWDAEALPRRRDHRGAAAASWSRPPPCCPG